jgi:uncharacterized membrane protein SpoIIM required for sporulation
MDMPFWNNVPPRRRRLIVIALVFVASVVATGLSTLTPMSKQDAEATYNQLNQTVTTMKESGALLQDIFGNNLMITVMMFIPFIGPILGFYVFYNTGVVIGAESIHSAVHPLLGFGSLWLLPVAWLEFAAYSTAIAASLWLTWRLMHGGAKHELLNTSKFLSICTLILLLSAIIETALV